VRVRRDDRSGEISIIDIDGSRIREIPSDFVWIVIHRPSPTGQIPGDIDDDVSRANEIESFITGQITRRDIEDRDFVLKGEDDVIHGAEIGRYTIFK